jgi:hypothetical protein
MYAAALCDTSHCNEPRFTTDQLSYDVDTETGTSCGWNSYCDSDNLHATQHLGTLRMIMHALSP